MLPVRGAGELVLIAAAGGGKDGPNFRKGPHALFQRLQQTVGILQGSALGQLDFKGKLALGQRRNQFRSQLQGQHHRNRHAQARRADHRPLVVQGPDQPAGIVPAQFPVGLFVAVQERVGEEEERSAASAEKAPHVGQNDNRHLGEDKAGESSGLSRRPLGRAPEPSGILFWFLRGCGRRIRPPGCRRAHSQRHHHGDEGERNQQGGQQRVGNGQGLVLEELPGDTFHPDERRKDGHRCQRRRRDRFADFPRSLIDRFGQLHSRPLIAVDGFEHDDGVVHQHPHAQRNAAQRHDIE